MGFKRDLKKLILSMDSLTNGQAAITVNEENMCQFKLTIIPNDGPYSNGRFEFEISYDDPSDYPYAAPRVLCTTRVYHPNIDTEDGGDTNVCLSLFDDWESQNTLEDVVQGLLFLFYNPNIEDPLNPLFNGTEENDEFEDNVRKSLLGEDVDGTEFGRNQVSDDPSLHVLKSTDVSVLGEDSDDQDTNNTADSPNNNDTECNDQTTASEEITSDANVTSNSTYSDQEQTNDRESDKELVTDKTVDEELESEKALSKVVENSTELESETSPLLTYPSNGQKKLNHYTSWDLVLQTATAVLTYVGFLNCYHTINDKIR